jgi:hypothetical protein
MSPFGDFEGEAIRSDPVDCSSAASCLGSSGLMSSSAEMFTNSRAGERPPRVWSQAPSCRQAAARTQVPSSRISPALSASGMKS